MSDPTPPPLPPPLPPPTLSYRSAHEPNSTLTSEQRYNVVSDVVVGVNLRKSDNLFQAVSILICTVLGAGIGMLIAKETMLGAVLGLFGGLLFGLFGSGIFLMIYRGVRHARGKHD
jgi:hypothetical protein